MQMLRAIASLSSVVIAGLFLSATAHSSNVNSMSIESPYNGFVDSGHGILLPQKTPIDQYLAEACVAIENSIKNGNKLIEKETVRKATQYFTPLFEPGEDGGLRKEDRRACINIEGSCIVGEYLYNYAGRGRPYGKRWVRNDIPFKFGKGNGKSRYNTTNALDPCRTLAADQKHYPAGTVIYMPSMKNKRCPQTLKKVDGCFIVGDVGAAIKGKRRFDIFTGECAHYNKRINTCDDPLNRQFVAPNGTEYYVVGRHNRLARDLRVEVDRFVLDDWSRSKFPMFTE